MNTSEVNPTNFGNFSQLISDAVEIKTQAEFLLWAQGALQEFLPHDLMIAAWGDFTMGIISYDIISTIQTARAQIMPEKEMALFLKRLYAYWMSNGRVPSQLQSIGSVIRCRDIQDEELKTCMRNMKTAMLHAIRDVRGGSDSFYVLLSKDAEVAPERRKIFQQLLPYIDASLRQIEYVPDYVLPMNINKALINEPVNTNNEFNLTDRESEIMGWVCSGKTNLEIGLILNISSFTVKNHLQRIFKKLDVVRRSQAVAKMRNQVYSS